MQAYRSGESSRVIARRLAVSKSALLDLLRGKRVEIRAARTLTEDEIDQAVTWYVSGLLLREVAGRLDASTTLQLRARSSLGARTLRKADIAPSSLWAEPTLVPRRRPLRLDWLSTSANHRFGRERLLLVRENAL